jgi:hypothetical protein
MPCNMPKNREINNMSARGRPLGGLNNALRKAHAPDAAALRAPMTVGQPMPRPRLIFINLVHAGARYNA